MSSAAGETWVDRYHRFLLDHVGASDDVDLTTVLVSASHEDAYRYSEYTGEDAHFSIDVRWKEKTPRAQSPHSFMPPEEPDIDGLYPRHRTLTNEEVAQFLNSLS